MKTEGLQQSPAMATNAFADSAARSECWWCAPSRTSTTRAPTDGREGAVRHPWFDRRTSSAN